MCTSAVNFYRAYYIILHRIRIHRPILFIYRNHVPLTEEEKMKTKPIRLCVDKMLIMSMGDVQEIQ